MAIEDFANVERVRLKYPEVMAAQPIENAKIRALITPHGKMFGLNKELFDAFFEPVPKEEKDGDKD